jgi:hypothetical protein
MAENKARHRGTIFKLLFMQQNGSTVELPITEHSTFQYFPPYLTIN